ncbi:MAG TPA: hypothetical protein VLR52_01005, partial [Bacteroidales bacterium]|nr:hypothetical protein [Bacteroidales bacterium]
MKRKTNSFLILAAVAITSLLLPTNHLSAQNEGDSLTVKVITLQDKVAGIEERVTTAEADLSKLTKIKLSGYIQAQYQNFENPSTYPYNYFSIRRARIKFQYEPATGVAFVLQPDLIPGGLALKDAYVQLNDPWMKTFSFWAGQFNRPNYEVEYSSSSREIAERSLVIRSLYPGERALGAKLEIAPPSVPIKVQIAVFNGNDALTITDAANTNVNPVNKDYDKYKDLMARATYAFKLGNLGGLNIGAHAYMGYTKAASGTTINGDYTLKTDVAKIGSSLNRSWFGVEAQLYLDILGGLTLKGEYLRGSNAYTGAYGKSSVTGSPVMTSVNDTLFQTTTITNTTTIRPNIIKKFQGYYVYLVKNIGKKNQFAVRYDYYDPNTDLKGDVIGVAKYDAAIASKTDTKTTYSGTSPVLGTTT